LAVHAFDGSLRFRVAGHLDKAETFGTTGVALHHHFSAGYATKSSEGLLQVFVAHRIWQVANVQFIAHEWDSYQSQIKSDGVPEQTLNLQETDRSPTTCTKKYMLLHYAPK
jgi:hypothetical protein